MLWIANYTPKSCFWQAFICYKIEFWYHLSSKLYLSGKTFLGTLYSVSDKLGNTAFVDFFLTQHRLRLIFISHRYICYYLTYFESFSPIEWEFVEKITNISHLLKQQWTEICCFSAKFSFFLLSITAAFDEWVRLSTFFFWVFCE
jgi:hypothetical protein